MAPDARLAVARRVIAQVVLIERQREAANCAIDLQKAVQRQATADKRAVAGYKARRSDPAGMATPSVESWVREVGCDTAQDFHACI